MRGWNVSGQILAHRGLWDSYESQNSIDGITSALKMGFGIETDLRDALGNIVIAHDAPRGNEVRFLSLLAHLERADLLKGRTLALNVKSDGLLDLQGEGGPNRSKTDYFYFDMSFPQLLQYAKARQPLALRVSEYEEIPNRQFRLLGVPPRLWVDGFESDWWLEDKALNDLACAVPITIVSPEIHGRETDGVWNWFVEHLRRGSPVSICTDRPLALLDLCQ